MNNKKTKNKDDQKTKKPKNGKVAKAAVLSTAFGLMASAIVGLSVSLYFEHDTVETHKTYQRQMDAVYSRAYYDLMDGASDLGVTLRKIGVSNSPKMQQSLLYEVWGTAKLAENSLSVFESADDGALAAQKFVNQLGDYSHTLANRIASGEALTAEERAKLIEMGKMADVYMKALEKINVEEGGFVGEDGALQSFSEAFSDFSDPSLNYPEMIYDGPFSDSLETRHQDALLGEEITPEAGEKLISGYLNGYVLGDVRFIGEGSGEIPTYNYSLKLDGMDSFIQLCKNGGALISLNTLDNGKSESAQAVQQEAGPTCQQNALEFAGRLGFKNMQVVWSSSMRGECCINLAPVENGVIIYSDLVKVKVRERDSRVIGLDATHYAFNHRERTLPTPAVNAETAAKSLSIAPLNEGRLALIPMKSGREVLTYEFECENNGTYFIYVDAMSGDEVNILYVIDSDMGSRTI